jgi:hypothetical protein
MHHQIVSPRRVARGHETVMSWTGVERSGRSEASAFTTQPSTNVRNDMNRNKCRILQQSVAALVLSAGLLMTGPAVNAATISILGGTPPAPGADDQSQTNMPAGANQPPGLNYYFDNGNAPSQTFTTGNNPNGYTLSSVAIYNAGNSGGGFGSAQTFTLYIYSVSGNFATLLTSYTSQSIALPDNQWLSWTELGAILQPNTQYAWSMRRNGSGWANVGNVPGDLYPAGEVASIPTGGGNLILSSEAGYDASFNVGLTPITAVTVGQANFSTGAGAVVPGTSVSAWATVNGPTPYGFQWRTDGGSGGALTNIPGATASNLVINTTGFTDGLYQYALVATNDTSSATGQVGGLQIQTPIGIPGVIGVKFAFAPGYATSDHLLPADNTGVPTAQIVPPANVPLTVVGNWNNLFADVPAAGGDRFVAINQTWNISHDSTGTPLSGVTLTPFGFNDGWFSGGTGCAAGRLLYNFWKFNSSADNAQFNGAGRLYATLTFNNLPLGKYDVIVYVNNNNGNYWGNMRANNVVAQGGTDVNSSDNGFNGASADPCPLATPLHTFGSYNGGNPANSVNYVRMANVATAGGAIEIEMVSFGGGNMGISGVQLVPVATLNLVQDITPVYVESVTGQPLALSVGFLNDPPVTFEWSKISGGLTNSVTTGITTTTNNDVVTSSLAFASLQLSDAGSYLVKVSNAGNPAEFTFTSAALVLVSNLPPAVGNVILHQEAQVGGNYYPPTWAIDPASDLIYGFFLADGSPGTALPGLGNFGLDQASGDPSILTDGVIGVGRSISVSGGPNDAGNSIIYGLQTNNAALGFEITNITVYAGWVDGGRRDQAYEVLYSTVQEPENFISLFTTHYLPDDPTGQAIASRTKLIPLNGVLARNVHSVKFNWEVEQFLNGYAFYQEIEINGTNSTSVYTPVAPGISSVTAVGPNLMITGSGGTPNASFTWVATTNLTPPIIWTPVAPGVLDGAGELSSSLPINPAEPEKYYRLRMP